jgi:predicted alpha/beta hydrolase
VKGSADLETIEPAGLLVYGQVCGHALARAHARSGDAALISGYVGSGDAFPDAIADFAYVYADQTERDHAALAAAVRSGKIEAKTGI